MAEYDGRIYAIKSPNTSKIYIGSTKHALLSRMMEHIRHARCEKVKCRSREIINAGDAYIELIEEYTCGSRIELTKREYEIMRNTPNIVNSYKGKIEQV